MKAFKPLFSFLAIGALCAVLSPTTASAGSSGSISFEIYKAGFIAGVNGGTGTLHYKGKTYHLGIGGVSLGTIGASKAELVGTAYNLKSAGDIAGTYSAVGAGLAIAGGDKVAQLKNSRGVVIKVKGKQIGLEASLDLSGMQIELKKKK